MCLIIEEGKTKEGPFRPPFIILFEKHRLGYQVFCTLYKRSNQVLMVTKSLSCNHNLKGVRPIQDFIFSFGPLTLPTPNFDRGTYYSDWDNHWKQKITSQFNPSRENISNSKSQLTEDDVFATPSINICILVSGFAKLSR